MGEIEIVGGKWLRHPVRGRRSEGGATARGGAAFS
jgi:hypothetical protein